MANLITIFRMLLTIVAVEYIMSGRADLVISAIVITLFVVILDGLDGVVARALKESSKFGSVFDIIGDRVVENIYWITFAVTGWVGLWVPLVVVSRGFITDGLRSMALAQGYTAFGEHSMIKNPIFKFITASRFSRALYGFVKVAAFILVIAAHIPGLEYFNVMTPEAFVAYSQIQPKLILTADICVYVTVALCVVRGLPVIFESRNYIKSEKND